MSRPPASPQPRSTERVALAVATLASFLTPFMGSAANVALPAIGREMGEGAVALSWVATSYLLAAAVVLLPFGKLADVHGRKRVFVGGLAACVASGGRRQADAWTWAARCYRPRGSPC